MHGIIFDLDQTLIDSNRAKRLRDMRLWKEVYTVIPKLPAYSGINQLLADLHSHSIPVAIVTAAPESYCFRVIAHNAWPVSHYVCWHDTKFHKPHPEPFLKACELMRVSAKNVMAVGDDPNDIIAARRAGMMSVAALWGCNDSKRLTYERPDHICKDVNALRCVIETCFPELAKSVD